MLSVTSRKSASLRFMQLF